MNDDLKSAFDKLLKEIVVINEAHEKECSQFNDLKAVLPIHDEVRMHSHFITSLLDPYAPHGMGKEGLRLFLKCINVDKADAIIEDCNLTVQPNYKYKTEYKNMDILVRTKRYAVLIENKIFASDSNYDKDGEEIDDNRNVQVKRKGQLERYYARLVNPESKGFGYYKKENIYVRYLTIDGHSASVESTGAIRDENDRYKFKELPEKVKDISYGIHILDWLKELVSNERINNAIKPHINQYIMIIKEMVNKLEVNERIAIVNTIGKLSLDERKALSTLFRNEKDICWHIADLFFQDLNSKTKENGIKMWIKQINDKNINEVDDICEMMPYILNDTVGPHGGKSIVHFFFSKDNDSPVLILDRGVIEFEGLKIDFNDLNSIETLNLSNEEYRKEKVKEVFEKMKGK